MKGPITPPRTTHEPSSTIEALLSAVVGNKDPLGYHPWPEPLWTSLWELF